MNTVFKIIMFGFFLNLAVGLITTMLPVSTCFMYNSVATTQFNATIGGVVNPSNSAQDQTSAFVRLIDSLNIGVIGKFLSGINYYLYGTIDFMRCMAGGMPDYLEYLLKSALTVAYIIGSIYLWTGRMFSR